MTERQRWMSVLARADRTAIEAALADAPPLPAYAKLRGPEVGLVMVRGRTGGGGAPFNFAEMTVTRCTVRADGRIGHAYIAGRDGAKAELAARLDAALQDSGRQGALLSMVIDPLESAEAARRAAVAARAAAARVDFFTLATMRS